MTLVELILVVTIVALLSGWGTVFYGRFLTQNQVDNIGDQVVQWLRKAQVYAQMSKRSETVGWGVAVSGGQMTLYSGATYAARNPVWDEVTAWSGSVTVSPMEVNFSRMTGVPDGPETITVAGGNDSQVVTVNSEGTVSRI